MSSTSERRAPRRAASPKAPGYISAGELYTLPELEARLQVGEWALRKARNAGLVMHKMGKRKFVLGADVIRFLQDKPASEPAENATDD